MGSSYPVRAYRGGEQAAFNMGSQPLRSGPLKSAQPGKVVGLPRQRLTAPRMSAYRQAIGRALPAIEAAERSALRRAAFATGARLVARAIPYVGLVLAAYDLWRLWEDLRQQEVPISSFMWPSWLFDCRPICGDTFNKTTASTSPGCIACIGLQAEPGGTTWPLASGAHYVVQPVTVRRVWFWRRDNPITNRGTYVRALDSVAGGSKPEALGYVSQPRPGLPSFWPFFDPFVVPVGAPAPLPAPVPHVVQPYLPSANPYRDPLEQPRRGYQWPEPSPSDDPSPGPELVPVPGPRIAPLPHPRPRVHTRPTRLPLPLPLPEVEPAPGPRSPASRPAAPPTGRIAQEVWPRPRYVPPFHRHAKPRGRDRERKMTLSLSPGLAGLANLVTESSDFINAIYNAIPWRIRRNDAGAWVPWKRTRRIVYVNGVATSVARGRQQGWLFITPQGVQRMMHVKDRMSIQDKVAFIAEHWEDVQWHDYVEETRQGPKTRPGAIRNLVENQVEDAIFGGLGSGTAKGRTRAWMAGFDVPGTRGPAL